jgi:integrase/recombinase XerC
MSLLSKRLRSRPEPAAGSADVPPSASSSPLTRTEPLEAPAVEVFDRGSAIEVAGPGPTPLVVRPARYDAGEVFKRFLLNRNANTRDAYRRDFELFAEWLGVGSPEEAAAVLLADKAPNANAIALEWLDSMRDSTGKQRASSTRARRLSTLKSFVKAARLLGAVNWAIEVEAPTVEAYRDTEGPTVEQVHKLFAVCGEGLEGLRNRAIMALFSSWGLRRKEIVEAQRQDYDGRRFFVHGKRDKDKWVVLPGVVVQAIDAWIRGWESAHGSLEGGGLFRSLSPRTFGETLKGKGLYTVMRELGKRAGIEDMHPHAMRHASVTAGLDATNGDMRAAQQHARHSDPKTTQRYDDNRTDKGAEVAQLVADRLIPR